MMNLELSRRSALACVGVVGIAAACPAAADTTLATLRRATPVTAYHGTIAWSRWDNRRHAFRLIVRQRDRTIVAPVPARSVPFDAQVGRGPRGKTTIVYSRCKREPISSYIGNGLPA